MEDERFKSIGKDPRCRDIPKNVRKVKVDKRFQKMLKHKQFKGNNRIDERGRTVNFSTSEKLKKLYHLNDSNEDDDSNSTDSEDDQDNTNKVQSSSMKVKKNEKDTKQKSKIIQDKKSNKLQKVKTKTPNVNSDVPEHGDNSSDDIEASEDKKSISSDDEQQNSENDLENVQKDKIIRKQEIKAKNNKSTKFGDLSNEKLSDASEEESDSDDSEDSDSTNDIFADPDEFDHNWEEWNEQAPDTEKIFKRLALCNMDWDRIRADDLFIVFNSFKPAGSTINSVKIYPSDFGLKRMDAERLKGPPELVEETLDPEAEEKLDKKRAKFHREKLREYQLKRLQYYYAVIDCDSPETADHLYTELNGKEYESSSVRFDLRFVPDDTTFDHAPISEAYKVPDASEYRPRYFVSTALGQAKVDLTWDETDPQRQEVLERAFKEPDNIEKDIKDYLASSSAESEEEQVDDNTEDNKKMKLNDRISKYKELLQSLEEKGKEEEEKYDMEISWQPDLKEKTEKLVKQKLEEPQNPFEEMIRKKKEERKLKKQKKNASNKDDEESDSESDGSDSIASDDEKPPQKENKKLDELYLISDSKKALDETKEKSSKKKKRKNKQQKKELEKMQDFKFVEDERFSAIYTSPEFNLDPSDPHFKKTEGNLAFIQEKQRRLKTKEPHGIATCSNSALIDQSHFLEVCPLGKLWCLFSRSSRFHSCSWEHLSLLSSFEWQIFTRPITLFF